MLERWSHLPTYKRRRAERHADAPEKEATVVQGPPDTCLLYTSDAADE